MSTYEPTEGIRNVPTFKKMNAQVDLGMPVNKNVKWAFVNIITFINQFALGVN